MEHVPQPEPQSDDTKKIEEQFEASKSSFDLTEEERNALDEKDDYYKGQD